MGKNYKRRGYPGKELKKKKRSKIEQEHNEMAWLYSSDNKHQLDCQIEKLRRQNVILNDGIGSIKIQLRAQMELLKEAKKEKSIYRNKVTGLQKHIESLKRHIVAMTPDPETMIKHTSISRAIKNMK